MILRLSTLFLAATLSLVPLLLTAQDITAFSRESPTLFLEQLTAFVTESDRKEAKDLITAFAERLPGYTPEQRTRITDVADVMLERKMTPAPYFEDYLTALAYVPSTGVDARALDDWHEALLSLLAASDERRPFANFLAFSHSYFATGALYVGSGGLGWFARPTSKASVTMRVESGEPVISFSGINLVASRRGDSIMIAATSGTYSPGPKTFVGNGGRAYWDRVGLNDTYVYLADYDVDVTKSLYRADSVKMTFPKYFGEGRVLGSFADKIGTSGDVKDGSYPRFNSYGDDLKLEDVGGGLSYTGGFSLQGLDVLGNSSATRPAFVELRNEVEKLVFKAIGPDFVIRQGERVVANQVAAKYFFGTDSIVHPSVKFRFDMADRVITLARADRAAGRNPFYSSLQDVNVDVDEVKIFVDQDSVLFGEKSLGISTERGGVNIQSLQYFSGTAYNRYQNIATYNPLTIIKAVSEAEGRTLDALELAQKIDSRFSLESVKSLYFDLVADGFIEYDVNAKTIYVKDRLFHFVEASQGKVDFDALRIASETKETNATLNVRTGDMLVNGVENLELSRKQRVALIPTAGQLVMKANRGIDFDGVLYAGYSVLEGKDLHFEYKPYLVDFDSVRFLDLFVPQPLREDGSRDEPLGVASRIEHVAGMILIDAPNNKSGREDITIFPSLQSRGPSYVYYDRPIKGSTVYGRDSFFFALDEFSLNSLYDYTDEDVRFTGTMYPAEIFPPYTADVYIKSDDRSLGHTIETPPAGWPMYGNRGRFSGRIDLGNSGYRGKGRLSYLSAVVDAEDFVFAPNQLGGTAESWSIPGDPMGPYPTPRATGSSVTLDYRPLSDSMFVTSDAAPFELFEEGSGHTLTGRLTLTPEGLRGQGTHDWAAATIESRDMLYSPTSLSSDTMDLSIKNSSGDGYALQAEGVNGRTDFSSGLSNYKANDEFLTVDLPANMYETSMSEFSWDVQQKKIIFQADEGTKGKFVSIDPNQDSLYFKGTQATYVLEGSALEIRGVDSIFTADAVVYPEGSQVSVEVGGRLLTLKNATLVADTVNRHHVIDSAIVEVFGRRSYTASGYYRYDLPRKKQRVKLNDIVGEPAGKGKKSEKASVTRASGEVSEAQNFLIEERTRFQGIFSFESSSPEVFFDGFAKLDAPALGTTRWFSIATPGNKDDLQIDYDLPQSPEGDNLHTGLYLSRAEQRAYPALFTPTHTGQDRPLIDLSEGTLDYRPATQTFVVGDSSVIRRGAATGGQMSVNANTGEVLMSGPLALVDAIDYISVKAAGTVATQFKTGGAADTLAGGSPDVEALMSIDLIIPDKLLNLVAADLAAASFDAPDINYFKVGRFLMDALPNWLDKPADTTSVAAARGQRFMLPKDELEHSFIFPQQKLLYNGEFQSFVSAGKELELAYLNGTPIHKRIEGYIEMKMPGSGDDRLYLYLKSPSGAWYFFGFKQGILNVASSNPRFMSALDGLKKRERTQKMDDGELYEIAPVNAGTANAFVNRVKEAQGSN